MRSWRLSRPSFEPLSEARFQVSKPCHVSPCPANRIRTNLLKLLHQCNYRHEWWLHVANFDSSHIENIFALPRAWWVEAVVTHIAITSRLRNPRWRTGLILRHWFHHRGKERVQAASGQRTNMLE